MNKSFAPVKGCMTIYHVAFRYQKYHVAYDFISLAFQFEKGEITMDLKNQANEKI